MIPGGPSGGDDGRVYEELTIPMLDDLYRLACRFESDPHRAQDLLQEALLTGFRKFNQLRDRSSFRAWITSIVRSTHLNRRASRVHRPSFEPVDDQHPVDRQWIGEPFDPERRLLARRLSQELKLAMDRLPEDQRVAVFLIDVQGFRYAEAAQALGVAPGTVASRVARARAVLRGFLGHVARERGWAKP